MFYSFLSRQKTSHTHTAVQLYLQLLLLSLCFVAFWVQGLCFKLCDTHAQANMFWKDSVARAYPQTQTRRAVGCSIKVFPLLPTESHPLSSPTSQKATQASHPLGHEPAPAPWHPGLASQSPGRAEGHRGFLSHDAGGDGHLIMAVTDQYTPTPPYPNLGLYPFVVI